VDATNNSSSHYKLRRIGYSYVAVRGLGVVSCKISPLPFPGDGNGSREEYSVICLPHARQDKM